LLGPLAKPSPKRGGVMGLGPGHSLISHDHALHNPAYLSTTETFTFLGCTGLKVLRGHPRPSGGDLCRTVYSPNVLEDEFSEVHRAPRRMYTSSSKHPHR
jgi:hypothetical protein